MSFLSNLRLRPRKSLPESIFFYTLHKCASSLFAQYIFKNVEGLNHVNYARHIYDGTLTDDVRFEKHGSVYGPIRLSEDPGGDLFKKLVDPISSPAFVEDKIAIFMVRDPRDILVSAYYSFGFTHGFSKVSKIRERQELLRRRIQRLSLDEYVLESAAATERDFSLIDELSSACERCTTLKYEDMIANWDHFTAELTRYIPLEQPALDETFRRSRPREKEDQTSHRRSGAPGGYKDKLKTETIASLNDALAATLERFQYSE